MNTDIKSIQSDFRRIILKYMEAIDIEDEQKRVQVYRASINALGNISAKMQSPSHTNPDLYKRILLETINEIEHQISSTTRAEKSSSENIKSVSIGSKTVHFTKRIIISICAVLLTAIIAFFALQYSLVKNKASHFSFPVEIIANKTLQQSIVVRGSGLVETSDKPINHILLEPQVTNSSKPIMFDINFDEETNRFLKAQKDQVSVIVNLKKLSTKDIKLKLLILGIGTTSHSDFTLTDNKSNQFFIVTNNNKAKNNLDKVIVRLLIMPSDLDINSSHKFVLEKITIDKI